MKKLATVLLSCFAFLTGCGSSQVQVALNPARLEPCQFVSTKEVYDPLGPKSLMAEAKDVAAKAGGNTILVGKEESGFLTEKATIEIYSCPALPPAKVEATASRTEVRNAASPAMKESVM